MGDEIIGKVEQRMDKAVEDLRHELATIRTGRASPALLDKLTVEYYGSSLPINQVASISVPEPRSLLITPFDRNAMGPIEKSIQKSDLGLTPNNDGVSIRLNIPPLTEERRKEFIKRCHKIVEDHRVAVRNIRRDANEDLKKHEKAHEVSEDDARRLQEKVQKLTDKYIVDMDKIQHVKEQELLEV
ncbi:MAG TPA: ribosome recycling factor [Armatimonadota bacterium]|jgi:ribosome recycling factor